MLLTRDSLLTDLYIAYSCAKRHKSRKWYVKEFEKDLHGNLARLCGELFERRYEPLPSSCFIIEDPKKREIFAAAFRDRIVHHLYYNYTYDLFDRTFIEDSYSCRVGKGTHYGVKRLDGHIRSGTSNYTEEAYALKMDIKGYFVHIDRTILLRLVNDTLDRFRNRRIPDGNGERYDDALDFGFLKYLSEKIIMLNPVDSCVIKCPRRKWKGLDKSKSLFHTAENCGLPIGNLTSQLFSNIYLNVLDQYMKRELKCEHYGRYVDDFYVIDRDKDRLKEISLKIGFFLKERLGLDVQKKKTHIINTRHGIEFLGAFVKHGRIYVSNKTLKRMRKSLRGLDDDGTGKDAGCVVNSYLGLFSHYDSYNVKLEEFGKTDRVWLHGTFTDEFSKFVPY